MQLSWPYEGATPLPDSAARFSQVGSNLCLDFHGDPLASQVVVFSDGNHHMALAAALAAFRSRHPDVNDVFYATTPPGVLVDAMKAGVLVVGNLRLTAHPDVFIGPVGLVNRLREEGRLGEPHPLAASRGNVMLVRKGNPMGVSGIGDLARENVRLFLSNPVTESVSYQIYTKTLRQLAARRGIDAGFLDAAGGQSSRLVYGERIHHREAPQYIADGRADVAIVFYHLALRYVRIFPDLFELVALSPEGDPDQLISSIAVAKTVTGSEWGARLVEFLLAENVAQIYREHGLVPAR
ncbi:MAG: substrate-binding domain-containing protein [Betaproteobacteria bacterium]|nr:substrate-binding domain-containing protein [Betaproteobacteria bacterium]